MRYLTAGESHGKGLTAILDGFPAGVPIDCNELNAQLRRRMFGYGRGARMQMEEDGMEILAGLSGSVTLGSPIAFFIANRDYENKKEFTDPERGILKGMPLTAVRPGHADYAGSIKYNTGDARAVAERASARETAARVGMGAFCRQLLAACGIEIGSHVIEIGGVKANVIPQKAACINAIADKNAVRCLDEAASRRMMQKIDDCTATGDTVGGATEVRIGGVPAGIGSHAQYDGKLDGILAQHFMSIQAVKNVAFGLGEEYARCTGADAHDEMFPAPDGGIMHKTNRAGGIEGGISNGEEIIARLTVKPVPTLQRGLHSVDIVTKAATTAAWERSDVCVVPAAGVVAENVAAFVILNELLRVTGGDDFNTIRARVNEIRRRK